MKKIIYKIIPILIVGLLFSCKDENEGISRVTIYPKLELIGDTDTFVSIGATYNDKGVIAKAGDDVIKATSSLSSGVYYGKPFNTNISDKYEVTYTAINADGIKLNSDLRTVWVADKGDLVNSISGVYLSNVVRDGTSTGDLKYVIISKRSDNTYEITNALGGYYDIGRDYGTGYAAVGAIITANDISANNFSISTSTMPIWEYTVEVSNFKVDATAKKITFTGTASFGGVFNVTLTQVQY